MFVILIVINIKPYRHNSYSLRNVSNFNNLLFYTRTSSAVGAAGEAATFPTKFLSGKNDWICANFDQIWAELRQNLGIFD